MKKLFWDECGRRLCRRTFHARKAYRRSDKHTEDNYSEKWQRSWLRKKKNAKVSFNLFFLLTKSDIYWALTIFTTFIGWVLNLSAIFVGFTSMPKLQNFVWFSKLVEVSQRNGNCTPFYAAWKSENLTWKSAISGAWAVLSKLCFNSSPALAWTLTFSSFPTATFHHHIICGILHFYSWWQQVNCSIYQGKVWLYLRLKLHTLHCRNSADCFFANVCVWNICSFRWT